MAGERMAELIQRAVGDVLKSRSLADLLPGTVVSATPLQVRVDSRFTLEAPFLRLSPFCKELAVTISGERVVLWRGLQAGDAVLLLRAQDSRSYYILDREVFP